MAVPPPGVDGRYNNNNFGHALDTGGVTLCQLQTNSNNFLTIDKSFAKNKFHKRWKTYPFLNEKP